MKNTLLISILFLLTACASKEVQKYLFMTEIR